MRREEKKTEDLTITSWFVEVPCAVAVLCTTVLLLTLGSNNHRHQSCINNYYLTNNRSK